MSVLDDTRKRLQRERAERNGQGADGHARADHAPAWTQPIPLDAGYELPPFPTQPLPPFLREWVEAEAEATQTPPDLAASLALSICGAALATKVRVVIRTGWTEPTNIFGVVSLPPGDRKSAVFVDALRPVVQHEAEEQTRMAAVIAEAASEHRMSELRLKIAEQQAAKAADPEECRELRHEAKQLAKELAAHVVPEPPQMFCDDETPENLGRLLAKQGGRMLQASAEGTAFEIVKGRYSEKPNFDVYLKGHAGDPLRTGRVGRERDVVDRPALSVAVAVQPDVVAGLAEQASLRGRGFLARFLYALPASRVGNRTISPRSVPKATDAAYRETVLRLWRLEGAVEDGKPAAHLLRFSAAADRRMQDFERWLEPRMAPGEDLSLLAGWAQKAAGAAARIAAILHVAQAVGDGRDWHTPISEQTVDAATTILQCYFLPHAKAAFREMGADPRLEDAKRLLAWLPRFCESVNCVPKNLVFSKRDVHANLFGGRYGTDDVEAVLAELVKRGYIRPAPELERIGPGRKPSSRYEINPAVFAQKHTLLGTQFTESQNSDGPERQEGTDAGVEEQETGEI